MAFPTTPTYQQVPQNDVEGGEGIDLDFEVPKYEESELAVNKRAKKQAAFHILAIVTVMYLIFYGVRHVVGRMPVMKGHGCGKMGIHMNMSTHAKLPTHFSLPSGDKIPSIALGVWRADKGKVGEAVKTALKAGYRHIDGAWIYGNEAEVGQAIKESDVPRKEIWLTSKLWNSFHAPEDIEPVLDESLSKLGTDYLDLYLIHWPVAFKKGKGNEVDQDLTENLYPTWQKLEELVEKGKIKNIGISNFNIKRIQNLNANPLKIKPAINQVELSYFNPQPELLLWAKENDLLLSAYSPLGGTERVGKSLEIPEVKKIAKKLGLTPAQVYISWHIQRGTVVLPKSVTPSRVEENFQVHRLPHHEFNLLERATGNHEPERSVDPSKGWGVDIFN